MLSPALLLLLLLSAASPPMSESAAAGPHIADLTVLLPPRMSNPVEYRLLGSDGCFSWSWDHHDILSVQPEYNVTGRCSTSARLISIAPYSGRKETAVYATDLQTGIVIRCEVFIDRISKIRIFHHSLKLDLDGLAPLQIRAFDDEENVFSSLVGLQFIWKLVPKSSDVEDVERAVHHLVHVPLKETPLSDCGGSCGDLNTQIKLEDRGVGSDLYVVRGIEIGQERISACMLEPRCEHVKDEIIITVAEAMSLDPPSPVYVIIGTTIQYELRIIRQNTPQVIELPSPYHRWSTSNSSVVHVDPTMGSVHASDFGVTSVIVEDMRVAGNLQISTMHVISPEELCLHLVLVDSLYNPIDGSVNSITTPLWYVVTGRFYIIHVKALLREPMQEIHLTKNNDVRLYYGHPEYWITSALRDEAYVPYRWLFARVIEPVSQGLGSLAAELVYKNVDIIQVLKVKQQVMVCNQVKIVFNNSFEKPQILHLPWLPDIYQEVKLTVSGGCAKTSKDYNWLSSDMTTVSVLPSGLICARRPGKATIKVVSVFDSFNYDELVIEVSVPSSMTIMPDFPVETAVGAYLYAAVTMKTSNGSYFHKCDAFHTSVKWLVNSGRDSFRVVDSSDESFVSTLLWSPCAWTRLYASSPGRATVHVTLVKESISSDNFFNMPGFLKKSFVVAAYLPLVVQQNGNGNQFGGYWIDVENNNTGMEELFLAPESEMDLLVMGGPEPWDQGVEYVDKAEVVAENHILQKGIIVSQAINKGGRVYRVSCQSLGNFKLVFSRGNLVGDGHLLPIIANVEVSLMCSLPSSITLIANEPENRPDVLHSFLEAERGPDRIRISPLSVANGCTIRLSAVGIHGSGKPFANSSSLCLRWQLNGCEQLAQWTETPILGRSECTWERFLTLQNVTGLCFVHAMVTGLLDSSSNQLSLSLKNLMKDLTDGLTLQLVSSVKMIPQSLLLFFNPEAKANLSIVGGTCLLESSVNDTDVAVVTKSLGSSRCSELVVYPKGIGVALVTVYDVGLIPPITSSSKVEVADVDWIKIVSQEVVYLMVGTTQSFYLSAGVHSGRVFDPSQYIYMDIQLHLEDDILELAADDNTFMLEQMSVRGSKFSLHATELGITTIHVTANRQSGKEISSQQIMVEVYAPLIVHPDNIFLAPGSSYALTVRGGPASEVVLEYASMNDSTAIVDPSSGRLFAVSEGNTTIRATVFGHGGETTSVAYAKVRVGIPSGIFLNLQNEQLGVGRDMKIHVSFSEGDAFSFFELCKEYKWTIEDEQVLSFRRWETMKYDAKIFKAVESDNLNYSDLESLDFMNIVFGRSAGRTSISVSFSCNFQSLSYSRLMSYKSSRSLVVIPDPPLVLGIPITWVLPPFYTTSELLPFPVESFGEGDSRSRKGSIAYSVLRICGKGDLVMQDPIVINGARIQTKESNNLACIQAKDRITGRAEIAACARVAEVDHIRVTSNEHLTYVVEVAVGDRVELLLNFQDALGIPFREAYGVVPVDIDTNYNDIVSIERPKDKDVVYDIFGKVYLQATHHGRALVRVALHRNPGKADYILVSVGGHMYPQNPVLSVGDSINFTVSNQGSPGSVHWLSANKSVILVDEHTGESHAIGEGSTDVFSEGLGLKLHTKVTVLKMASILVKPPVETLTNVLIPSNGYSFSVTFSDSYSQKVGAGSTGEVPFHCTVDPSFVGSVKPWIDLDTGKRYCLFFPHSPEHLANTVHKLRVEKSELIDSFHDPRLYVTVGASLREAPEVMGVAQTLFVGGFSVIQENKCHLVPNKGKCFISLVGNTDVAFHWNAKDQLLVKFLGRDDYGIGGRAEYEVSVRNGNSFADKVVIFLPHTGQKVEVDVTYAAGERLDPVTKSTFNLSVALWTLLSLIVSSLAFLFLMRKMGLARRVVSSVPAYRVPSTPQRSPGSDGQISPSTPQPYLEYVRRTIQETPYYKHNGRRRFDPQNTY